MSVWTKETDQRQLCPKCKSTQVNRNDTVDRENPEEYQCDVCSSHFDEPTVADEVCPDCENDDIEHTDEDYECPECGSQFTRPNLATDLTNVGNKGRWIPMSELVYDVGRVAEVVGNRPTTTEYSEYGEYSVHPYYDRFDGDSWPEIVDEVLRDHE